MYGSDESMVILVPIVPLTPNAAFLLRVSNVADFASPPNVISPNPSQTTFTTGP